MRSSRLLAVAVATMFVAVASRAAHVDMTDPKRALGREDDVRIDAQLIQDTVSSGASVGVTYQIQNLTQQPIALADKVCDLSYDVETQTITLSVGSEVPKDGEMPHVVRIAAGEKKTFTTGAILHIATPHVRSPFVSTPRFVEIKVSFLRDVAPFASLIDRQADALKPVELTDKQFDQWIESNDTIFLNAIPVRYDPGAKSNLADASQRGAGTF